MLSSHFSKLSTIRLILDTIWMKMKTSVFRLCVNSQKFCHKSTFDYLARIINVQFIIVQFVWSSWNQRWKFKPLIQNNVYFSVVYRECRQYLGFVQTVEKFLRKYLLDLVLSEIANGSIHLQKINLEWNRVFIGKWFVRICRYWCVSKVWIFVPFPLFWKCAWHFFVLFASERRNCIHFHTYKH